ncbi:MAG: transporter substrate-binding domain-containing protein, partial [Chloroflexota bacterium]|nr:transporter substrate-binding domain-containing protein [Chloroflexota bacterium]
MVLLLLAAVLGYYLWSIRWPIRTTTSSPLTSEEQGWLATKGGIVVAGPLDPPFAYLDEKGEYVGFTLDLLDALEMVLGAEFRFSPMGRTDAIPALDQGLVDAVLGEVPTPGSGRTYSLPYLSSSAALFVSRDDFLEPDNLEGETVAVVRGGRAYEFLSGRGGIVLLQVAEVEQGLKELQSGGVRAFVGDENAGSYTLQRLGLEEIKILGEPLERVNYSFAVRNDDRTLLRALDHGLVALEE